MNKYSAIYAKNKNTSLLILTNDLSNEFNAQCQYSNPECPHTNIKLLEIESNNFEKLFANKSNNSFVRVINKNDYDQQPLDCHHCNGKTDHLHVCKNCEKAMCHNCVVQIDKVENWHYLNVEYKKYKCSACNNDCSAYPSFCN